MRLSLLLSCLLFLSIGKDDSVAQDWQKRFETAFEKSDGWETVDYRSAIQFHQDLAKKSPQVTISEIGNTDSGIPLHLVLISRNKGLGLNQVRGDRRSGMLVNNASTPANRTEWTHRWQTPATLPSTKIGTALR